MKHLVTGAFTALVMASAAWAADPAEGLWKTAEGEEGGYLHVQIGACGNALCGTIAKAFDASGQSSGDYEHLGKRLIWDMQAKGDGSYSGGKVWAPDTDKTYRSKMSLSGNKLTVKGCVAGGAICRGQDWTRLN
ncbi:MAG: DUF2147 domain-containing protein [Paracoccaceae bacterium]